MTTKLTIGDWMYLGLFASLIVWAIYATRKNLSLASNENQGSAGQQS